MCDLSGEVGSEVTFKRCRAPLKPGIGIEAVGHGPGFKPSLPGSLVFSTG